MMKLFISTALIIVLGLLSCSTGAQEPDNTIPMYGNIVKRADYKKIDEDFIKQSIKQFGTTDSAAKAHIDFAWRYFYNNDLKMAMRRFNQAWLLNDAYPDIYFGFAALTEMQGNKTDASKFYEMGIAKDKTGERATICFQRIADCKEQLGDINGTMEAYSKILAINPSNTFALKKTGYFQMQTGKHEKALAAYNKAIALDPRDAMTYNNRAYLYQTIKDYKNALTDYNKAIELDAQYIGAYVNRGLLAMEVKNYEAAKKDFELSVKLDAAAPELRKLLGLAKLSLKDKSGACENFMEARKLGDPQIEELIQQNCK